MQAVEKPLFSAVDQEFLLREAPVAVQGKGPLLNEGLAG